MFEINRKTQKKVLSELQTQLKQFGGILQETEETVSKFIKCGQTILPKETMLTEVEAMKLQRRKMFDCVSVLRQVIELYEKTEEQILEYDGVVAKRPTKEATWIPVQYSEETGNFIRQIKI